MGTRDVPSTPSFLVLQFPPLTGAKGNEIKQDLTLWAFCPGPSIRLLVEEAQTSKETTIENGFSSVDPGEEKRLTMEKRRCKYRISLTLCDRA
jgi:hypothetical protein